MSRFHARWLVLLLIAALVPSGCATVGPDYETPEVSTPQAWRSGMGGGPATGDAYEGELASWWSSLNDVLLADLIGRAVEQNHDLQAAKARIREARAGLGISGSGRFPSVDASGSGRISRGSEETGSGSERKLYDLGLDASWELDIFGGVRRRVEAAEADLQASREDLRDVLVTLAAEIGLNYVEVRTFQARIKKAETGLSTQEDTYFLVKALYDSGLRTALDAEQARLNLENTRSRLPALRTGLEGAMNRIAVLLGLPPGSMHDELYPEGPIPQASEAIAMGVPADILRQRPDVRRAERELAAQTARVGVATAELYPKLTLTGSVGLEALSPDRLFLYGSRTYRVGPGLSWPVFRGGAIRKEIEVQSARQEQALIGYEDAVLAALEEVENAMVAYAQDGLEKQALLDAAQAARNAEKLSQDLYFSGLADFQNVLDAQRTLLDLEDRLAVSEGGVTSDLIRIYKSLGGGWTSYDEAVYEGTDRTTNRKEN